MGKTYRQPKTSNRKRLEDFKEFKRKGMERRIKRKTTRDMI